MRRNCRGLFGVGVLVSVVVGLAGCQTVAQQTGLTRENGVDLGPAGEQPINIGTSTERHYVFCWNANEQAWTGNPERLIVKEESFTDSFYKLTAGTGQAMGGAGLLTLGIKGLDNSANASANATATSTPPRPAPQ